MADDPVRGFSLGMRQRLGLAAALLGDPRLLVLDEPANGLDPPASGRSTGSSPTSRTRGATVVLSSHRMDDLAALCDEVTLLSTGRVVFSGPVRKLAAESGELDYRLVTSDPDGARRRRLQDVVGCAPWQGAWAPRTADAEALVVRGPEAALDELVVAAGRRGHRDPRARPGRAAARGRLPGADRRRRRRPAPHEEPA